MEACGVVLCSPLWVQFDSTSYEMGHCREEGDVQVASCGER